MRRLWTSVPPVTALALIDIAGESDGALSALIRQIITQDDTVRERMDNIRELLAADPKTFDARKAQRVEQLRLKLTELERNRR